MLNLGVKSQEEGDANHKNVELKFISNNQRRIVL